MALDGRDHIKVDHFVACRIVAKDRSKRYVYISDVTVVLVMSILSRFGETRQTAAKSKLKALDGPLSRYMRKKSVARVLHAQQSCPGSGLTRCFIGFPS